MDDFMRRLFPLFLFAAILLSACAPTIILLGQEPETSPTAAAATKTPRPVKTTPASQATPTVLPSPTPVAGSQLGISPDALRGLTITVWHGWDGEATALFSQMATEFSLGNAWGISVNVVPQKNLALLAQSVDSAMKTSERPDLLVALPEQALAWDDAIVDLAPYVSQPEFGLSAAEINDIPAAFWKQSDVNGKRLGVPAARTARFLFYNVSFAKELGFDAPPQTADDFRKQACAANQSWKTDADLTNDGYGGWVLDNVSGNSDAPWTAYAWLEASGGEVYQDGQFNFATPENIAALEFLSKLRADGCVWLSSADTNYEALAVHKALFIAGSLTELPDQRRAFAGNPDQWTVIPFPGAERVILTYGPDYVVLKSSEARQLAAWLFARWMLSPENQARWVRQTGLFPVRTSAQNIVSDILTVNLQWAAAADLIPQARTYPQSAAWRKARLVLGDGFFSLFQLIPAAGQAAQTLAEMDGTLKEVLGR
jgi:ABC-type glycerol-3-phosphate transport system substrate-binding protein